ncbi:MAG TPA: hemolysin family protein [Anaerolineaceae bacterium]
MINILWALLVILVVLDIILAIARASLLNARQPYLLNLREHSPERVDQTLALIRKPRLRVSLRLGMVGVHFLLAGVVVALVNTAILQTQNGETYSGIGIPWINLLVLIGVVLVMLFMEFIIEGWMLKRAEAWALRLTVLGGLIDKLLSPISHLLMLLLGSPEMLERRLSPVTEDELKTWAMDGQPNGTLEGGERRMIYSIFQFGNTLAREIMVPRIDIYALDVNMPLREAIVAIQQAGHSRVPVYEDSIDSVCGVLYARDLLKVIHEDEEPVTIRSLLRPVYFVPEAKKVDDLLRDMQSRRVHMAIVVDEYGGVAGLVTLEDIVEEIVGEIQDEYDQAEEQPYQEVAPGEYIFQGLVDLAAFNEIMGSHLPRESADTLGGFIYGRIGRVPAGGETIEVDDLFLIVEQVSGRRIRKVRAQRKDPTRQVAEEKKDEQKHKSEG